MPKFGTFVCAFMLCSFVPRVNRPPVNFWSLNFFFETTTIFTRRGMWRTASRVAVYGHLWFIIETNNVFVCEFVSAASFFVESCTPIETQKICILWMSDGLFAACLPVCSERLVREWIVCIGVLSIGYQSTQIYAHKFYFWISAC